MRSLVTRQRLARATAIAASIALVAACGPKTAPTSPDTTAGTGSTEPSIVYAAGTLLVSNGTTKVSVGGTQVTFPTTVTDATWSPDGSRILFVDGAGNIASARPDGRSLVVLAAKRDGAVRSQPAWLGQTILFSEKSAGGGSRILQVSANGQTAVWQEAVRAAPLGGEAPEDGNSAASGSVQPDRIGALQEIAFQHQGAKGPEVWVVDLNQREPWATKVDNGSAPAVSPDGTKVAYVAANGQVKVSSTARKASKPAQITFGAASPGHLAWSADGSQVAFATATDVQAVPATVPAGATTNAATQVAPAAGVPTYLPAPRDQLIRITGSDPVTTALAGSRNRWPDQDFARQSEDRQPAAAVVLVSTKNLPYALAASQLAWDAHGPVLFTGQALDPRTGAEISRVLGKVERNGYLPTVYLVGGVDDISAAAENAIRTMGYRPQRVTGADQYAVAAAAAQIVVPARSVERVLLVSAKDPAALVSALANTAGAGTSVLLTDGATVPDAVRAYLTSMSRTTKVYTLGSAARDALASSWPSKPAGLKATALPWAGDSTALEPVTTFRGVSDRVVVVTAATASDAVVAVSLAHGYDAALLVPADPAGFGDAGRAWLDASSASVDTALIVDSGTTVGRDTEGTLGGLLSGPLGYSTGSNTVNKR